MNANDLYNLIKPFIQNYTLGKDVIEDYRFINQLVEDHFEWFKQIPDIIYFFDETLTPVWDNGCIETMLGYNENELVNKYFNNRKSLYYLPDNKTELKRQSLISKGVSYCSFMFIFTKNMAKIPVCSQAVLIAGNPQIGRKLFLGYVQDFSCIFAEINELNSLLKIQVRINENIKPIKLTKEEKKVLVAYMKKYSSQSVCDASFKAKKTIYWYRRKLKSKFKARNFEQILITYALYHYGVD